MAAPDRVDLVFVVGDDFSRTFTFQGSEGVLDLTGITGLVAEMRSSYTATSADATFDTTDSSLPDGQITISLDREASAELEAGTYYWDLEYIDTDDKLRTWLAGIVRVLPQVSRQPVLPGP